LKVQLIRERKYLNKVNKDLEFAKGTLKDGLILCYL
jgi:hypothetical protein